METALSIRPGETGLVEGIAYEPMRDLYLKTLESAQTRRAYGESIDGFFLWLGRKRHVRYLNHLTVEDLAAYRDWLKGRVEARSRHGDPRGYSPATAARKLAAVRGFLKFAYFGQACLIPPSQVGYFAKSPRVPRKANPSWLTTEEIARLLEVASGNQRDYALLYLLLGSGLRVSEACSLLVGDLAPLPRGGALLTVRHGKGEKERSFRIDGPVFQVVKAYIEGTGRSFANSKDLASVLFRSRQGNGGLTTVRAWQIITSYAREAGIAKVTSPHVMRHTFATQCLLQRKAPPVQVLQKVLGHSQLDTTMRYAHIADQARMYSLTGSWLPA